VIFEYALEPELVATWHDRQSADRFKESFGVGRGRLVSRYPGDWIGRVWRAFDSSDQNAKKRLEALLTVLTHTMTSRGSVYNGLVPWLENAEMEHARSAFHAILALQNPRRVSGVLLEDRLDETSEPLWTVATTATVPRHASALAGAVAPLLKISKHILLIDQHFNPSESRYRNSLEALLGVLNEHRTRVEVHSTADGINKPTAAYFQSQCRQLVQRIIPAGLHVRFVRWHQRPGGETLHHRYILTELGGVSLLHGFDEGPPGETNEINIQSKNAYDLRWAQYAGNRPAFELADEITIAGTK
jgi:hypothetical protein